MEQEEYRRPPLLALWRRLLLVRGQRDWSMGEEQAFAFATGSEQLLSDRDEATEAAPGPFVAWPRTRTGPLAARDMKANCIPDQSTWLL